MVRVISVRLGLRCKYMDRIRDMLWIDRIDEGVNSENRDNLSTEGKSGANQMGST